MSSHEGNNSYNTSQKGQKKQPVRRACDTCRRKKVRCDGERIPGAKCSNCAVNKLECTYFETNKKRFPESYVKGLETRLTKIEKLFRKFCPDVDLERELEVMPVEDAARNPTGDIPESSRSTSSSTPYIQEDADTSELYSSDDEASIMKSLEKSFQRKLSLAPEDFKLRYHGKSSNLTLIRAALEIKQEYEGNEPSKHQEFSSARQTKSSDVEPWIISTYGYHGLHLSFPEDDLLDKLLCSHFEHGAGWPILHRPTFERDFRDGLHRRDINFGFIVLLVCALGSRFCDDPRVYLEGTDNTLSAGWKWFDQVRAAWKAIDLAPRTIYDLQIACLSAAYLFGTSAPQAAWYIVGNGIRIAQELGAHRRKTYGPKLSAHEELMKRAFWILVSMDRAVSSGLGRACCIQDEDFDVDLPTECDDEYWTDFGPDISRQPANRPSKLVSYNCHLRLSQISAFILRTVYAINKSKVLLGYTGPHWRERIVAQIDSELNKWIDSVPEHLRWDPKQENIDYLKQSAGLYAPYYMHQLMLHRPFLPTPGKPSQTTFPSLTICTNAARSCIRILDTVSKRTDELQKKPSVYDPSALFNSAMVLLLNIWTGSKHLDITIDRKREMADIYKAMNILKAQTGRSAVSNRLLDLLCEIAGVGDLPLPEQFSTRKRRRDNETTKPADTATQGTPSSAVPRKQARLGDYEQDQWSHTSPSPIPADLGVQDDHGLPVQSSELGQISISNGHTSHPYDIPHLIDPNNSWGIPSQMHQNPPTESSAYPSIISGFGEGVQPMDSSIPLSMNFGMLEHGGSYPTEGEAHFSSNHLSEQDVIAALWSSTAEWNDWEEYMNIFSEQLDGAGSSQATH